MCAGIMRDRKKNTVVTNFPIIARKRSKKETRLFTLILHFNESGVFAMTGYVNDMVVYNLENNDNLSYFCELVCDEISNDETRRAYNRMFSALRRSGFSVDETCDKIRMECLQDDLFFDLLPRVESGIFEYTRNFYGVKFTIKA